MNSSKLRNFEVWYESGKEFHSLKREIFGEDVYWCELENKDPVIFDVGAHIGLATLYFKMIYPQSKILAVEPNPKSVAILKKNIEWNRLEDVEVLEVAVGAENGDRSFFEDVDGEWLSSSSFSEKAWNDGQNNKEVMVKVVKLGGLINEKIDLLKLDVEGAEEEVIVSLGGKLEMIERIVFEYHPKRRGTPERIIAELGKYGFIVSFSKRGRDVDWRKAKGLLIGEAVRSR